MMRSGARNSASVSITSSGYRWAPLDRQLERRIIMVKITVLLAAAIVLGTAIAKIIEWHRDVLHGASLDRNTLAREVNQDHKKRI
jgi:hypothetical protein